MPSSHGGILRLGVTQYPLGTSIRKFDVGGVAVITSIRPFNIEQAPVTTASTRPFDINGITTTTSIRPFDILGRLRATSTRPFDIIESIPAPLPGTIIPGTGGGTTTLTATASAGATTVTVSSTTGFAVGEVIRIGTSSEYRTILSIPDSTHITFSTPLGASYLSGAPLLSIVAFIPSISVFDKAGVMLGAINDYTISASPSRVINGRGSMTFYVPRVSPDVTLLADDRLVAVHTEINDELWAGTMAVTESGGGMLQVRCEDAFELLSDGVPLTLDEETADGTPASAIYGLILDRTNTERGLTGEILWQRDLSGTKPFRGDLVTNGSPLEAIETTAARSDTEYAWRATLNTTAPHLTLTFVCSDHFSITASTAFSDGANGNIASEPRITQDATPVINYIRLRGQPTHISDYVPDWAKWAVHEFTPEVTAFVDPGAYRRRADLEVTVDWSVSKTQQRAIAQKTIEVVWEMYASYIRAVHDWDGRPFHEGWKYEGVPNSFGSRGGGVDAMSRRTWTTRLQLLETYTDHPVSGVMISDSHSAQNFHMWMIHDYDRVTGIAEARTWPISSAGGASLVEWHFPGAPGEFTKTLYRVSAGRIVGTMTTTSPNFAFVASYNVRVYNPATGHYANLRQFISSFLSYNWWLDPTDNDGSYFVDLGPESAISATDSSGSSLIGKMYDFEAYRVKDWDPRRDGIGELVTGKTSAWAGSTTTRPRWKFVSFDVGNDASTVLLAGITASQTDIAVQSVQGFPNTAPFDITVDDGLAAEDMHVTVASGGEWTVTRGLNGTTAIIHEEGAPVHRLGAPDWNGYEFPWTWDEGQAYADDLVARLSQPQITVNIRVANVDDLWTSIALGSVHGLSLLSEGGAVGWVGDVRVRGYAVDATAGFVELILDWLG